VACAVELSNASSFTITDSASQTWTFGTSLAVHWYHQQVYKINSSSISGVTISTSTGTAIVVLCAAFKGATWGSTDILKSNDNGFTGGTCTNCAWNAGSGINHQANEFGWVTCADTTAEEPVSYAAGSGWTAGVTSLDDANMFDEWQQITSISSYIGNGTYSNVASTSSDVGCIFTSFDITLPTTGGGSTISGSATISGKAVVK
jgi:hypothetical protein